MSRLVVKIGKNLKERSDCLIKVSVALFSCEAGGLNHLSGVTSWYMVESIDGNYIFIVNLCKA